MVCERHFSSAQIQLNLKNKLLNLPVPRLRNLKQDAIPDQNLPSVKVSSMCYACETVTVDAGEANTKLEVEIL